MRRLAGAREIIDGPVGDDELVQSLREIERTNRWFGGLAPVVREVRRSGGRRIVDVGSGGGDVARALVRDARRRGRPVELTLLDRSAEMLAIARRTLAADGDTVACVAGDGLALPFPDASFDVAVCTLALHHFEPDVAPRLLRELRRVARRPIVCDLRRSAPAFVATWVYAHGLARDRLTRHDAPLSVRRAYTPREALALAHAAGWTAPVVRREAWFRMTLVDGAGAA